MAYQSIGGGGIKNPTRMSSEFSKEFENEQKNKNNKFDIFLNKIQKYLFVIPILLLVASLLSSFIKIDYIAVGNILGYSIATNIVFYFYFRNKRNCPFSRSSIIGLFLLNIICLLESLNFIDYKSYSFIYDCTVCIIVCVLWLIYRMQKS